MRLRPFKKCDAEEIVTWIENEHIFRLWCADRFESYPISAQELIQSYNASLDSDEVFHFVAYDESGISGYFIIRYPDKNDINTVRLGFVLLDNRKRGQGLGKQMIKLAIDYAVNIMGAKKVTIGVFENNPSALNCYLKSGFMDTGITDTYPISGEEWICRELVFEPIAAKKES